MIKKSLLLATAAAAAAASFAAPVSAAEVKAAAYADLRYGIDYFNDRGSANSLSTVNFNNHGSYWGFKGSTEQGGITAFGAYDRWLDGNSTNSGYDLSREAYAGVKTAFGTVQFGTFATAYMESGRKLDPFYATGAAGVGRPGTGYYLGGQSHGLSALTSDQNTANSPGGTGGFVSNQLAYTSPSFFGVTVNAAAMFDNTTTSKARDDYAAGVEFNNFGITAGLQYLDANAITSNTGLTKGTEAYRAYGGYNRKRFGANVSAERVDLQGGATKNQDYLMASGWFGVMEGTRVAASFGKENETGTEGSSFRVGLFYDVLDNFTTHVVYRNFNSKVTTSKDDQVISLGATYKFELSGSANTR